MRAPAVSVVIPTFDRGAMLLEAVTSALDQSYSDLEVIVADDGSTDGSVEPLRDLSDPRVRVLSAGHTGVPGATRNRGVEAARGELVAFLDSDDVWCAEKLAHQIAVLEARPEVGLVCSNARVIDASGMETGPLYLPPGKSASGSVLEELLDDNFVITSSAVVRRALLEQVGGFTELAELTPTDDYDAWLRIATRAEVVYLDEPLLGYRQHTGSIRRRDSRTSACAARLQTVERIAAFAGTADPRQGAIRRRRAALLLELAGARRAEEGLGSALRTLARALHAEPAAVASVTGRRLGLRARAQAGSAARAVTGRR